MEMTNRIITAVSNENMTILAHPTGRKIGQREEYQVNIDRVMDAAKDKGVFLEINSFIDRLDLNNQIARKARGRALDLAIHGCAQRQAPRLHDLRRGHGPEGLARSGKDRQHPAAEDVGKDSLGI